MAQNTVSTQQTQPPLSSSDGADGTNGPFDHPVYKKLAVLNGEINKMTKHQMIEKLEQLHLDTRGLKDVLKKRLKNYYKRNYLACAKVHTVPNTPRYSRLLVIDFEATCERGDINNYPHEIIEFPVVLVDATNRVVIDEFQSYVRPTINPRLSEFCTELTGISQKQVDDAPLFPEVLEAVDKWMERHQIGTANKFAVVTDGPWDMIRFMHLQCQGSDVPFPRWARKWINIRKSFCNKYRTKKASILTMLDSFGLVFEGQQHSGIADARNIARILIQMLKDGCDLNINERIHLSHQSSSNVNGGASVASVPRNHSSSEEDDDTAASEAADDPSASSVSNPVNLAAPGECCRDSTLHSQVSENKNPSDANKSEIKDSEVDDCADLLQYVALQNS